MEGRAPPFYKKMYVRITCSKNRCQFIVEMRVILMYSNEICLV